MAAVGALEDENAQVLSPPSTAILSTSAPASSKKTFFHKFGRKQSVSSGSQTQKIFGAPLLETLRVASVAISALGPDDKSYIYGYVPVCVAKCGLFLKQEATEVEGVFRISGSAKRMKELVEIFDTGPRYGKDLVWEPWSVHDAANVLRRYLNMMPDPILPYELYNDFRSALPPQDAPEESASVQKAIKRYQELVQLIPPASQYLLFYILDVLAIFARKHEKNLMPASNLAVVFQPGLLRSRDQALPDANIVVSPNQSINQAELSRQQDEIRINQEVLEFLIKHQDHFVAAAVPEPNQDANTAILENDTVPAMPESTEMRKSKSSREGGGGLFRTLSGRRKSDASKRAASPAPIYIPHSSGRSSSPIAMQRATSPTRSLATSMASSSLDPSSSWQNPAIVDLDREDEPEHRKTRWKDHFRVGKKHDEAT